MSFLQYQNYKYSGFDWLGKIPDEWSLGKFRHLFSESSEKIESGVYGEMLSVSGYRGIEVKEYADENQKRTEENLIGYRIVHQGQLVVNTMWLNYAGLGISQLEGHVSPAYRSYWVNDSLHKPFVHHLMRSSLYVLGYTKYLTGVRPNSLQMGRDDLMSFPIVIPSLKEQKVIASFLDHEVTKIDKLVAEQGKLIELLKEKRQAVISNAVTKGLNPNVKMKNSGVEWLGVVPEHWTLRKLKYISEFAGGGTPSRENLDFWNGEIPWVSPKDMKMEFLENSEEKITQQGLNNSSSNLIEAGQILMVVRSGILKHTIPVAINIIPVSMNQDMKALKFSKTICISEFFMRWVQGLNDLLLLEWAKQGATVESIEHNYLKETVIPLPPLEEQIQITQYLKRVISEFEGLMNSSESSINLLQERRSALISAAVTGQIDVRNFQVKEAS